MACSVFISYARTASAGHAQALAESLGELAFLDTSAIDDGDHFPPLLLNGLLEAYVVVIFATRAYSERRFCRLEMRLALAAGDPNDRATPPLVLALGHEAAAVLDAMPEAVADQNWPPAEATPRLEELVRWRLQSQTAPLRAAFTKAEAQNLASAFLQESKVLEPLSLQGIVCSLPAGVAGQSIGSRFVGRADDLRHIYHVLSQGSGESARLTSRIAGGGGFGKTRLAAEYLHRYGPRYYRGGLFWLNASSSSLDDEFWRILNALDPAVPSLAALRRQRCDVRRELEFALRGITQPALYVVDNIPEAAVGDDAASIGDFCPALGAVTVLATSRQDAREEGVKTISVDTLGRDAAILLLTESVPGAGRLAWADWGRIAEWVGDLPLALDLLNRCLALNSITAADLLAHASALSPPSSPVAELDSLREALRGQVPRDAVRGITEAFWISFTRLDPAAQQAAMLLAHLAAAPIPEELLNALPEKLRSPQIRTALRARHFVTSGDGQSFGVMHRLMADFLRKLSLPGKQSVALVDAACVAMSEVMTPERCRDPRHWSAMNLLRPHAEALFARVAANTDQVPLTAIALLAAILASAQGDHAGARQLAERVLDVMTRLLGEEDPQTLEAMGNLAATLWEQGDHDAARGLEERVLGARTRVLGEEHQDTLTAMNNLALTLLAQGDYAGAQRLQERALEVITRLLGEEHPHTLTAMNNLALTLGAQGDHAGAQRLAERVLEVITRLLGEEHPDTLTAISNLAATLWGQGDRLGARRLQERVLEVRKRVLGKEHPDTLRAMHNLAITLRAQGDHAGARRLQEQALEVMTHVLGEEHPHTLTVMWDLGLTFRDAGEHGPALQLLRKCLTGRLKVLGDQHPDAIAAAEFLKNLEDEREPER